MKQRISYNTKKNPLNALFGRKQRTFFLSPPDPAKTDYLFQYTEIQAVAEGKKVSNKDDLSKIVAACTVKYKIFLRPFTWYLNKKLDHDTLSKLALVVATLIRPEAYQRPLSFETVVFVSAFPYK